VKIGELDVTAISDGFFKAPPAYFGQEDWGRHADLAGPDGTIEFPIGCFLVRTGDLTVLIDAGIGPFTTEQFGGGALPGALAEAGCKPEDVDLIIATHLHFDHIGWAVQNGERYFPNATIRFGEQDLDQFVRTEKPDRFSAPYVEVLEKAGCVETITSDGEVAPGISTLHAPGHTLGHRVVVLSSGDERALLLGDAVSCPVQLEETDWGAMSDIDPALAKRTREALFDELEGSGDITVGAHFPGLEFGRVLRGEGKRLFS
jgi:glyoxylase-like metal-dependent hydrolase (beta-lactamase superfamily II)